MSFMPNYIEKLNMSISQSIIVVYIENNIKYHNMTKWNYNIEYIMMNLQCPFIFLVTTNIKQYLKKTEQRWV